MKNPLIINWLQHIFGAGFQKALQVFDSTMLRHACA
jgi:hypothetical protein